MPPLDLRFRAYRPPAAPNRCAEQAGACVARWLQADYVLTAGPPAPFACPENQVPRPEAPALLRQALPARQPLHLWRYPLAFRLQLWCGGWDLAIVHRRLHTGTPTGPRAVRRRFLQSALQELIVATEPWLLIGPLARRPPPAYLAQALRGLPTWPLVYMAPPLAAQMPWTRLLRGGTRVQLQALATGGVLLQQG